MEYSAAQVILYLYWTTCIALLVVGLPKTFRLFRFPTFLTELFEYGKTRGSTSVSTPVIKLIEVPKHWFLHFYIIGLVVSSYMLSATTGAYFFRVNVPGVDNLAAIAAKNKVQTNIDEYAVVIVCLMMFVQHSRRIYECLYVSVYSKGSMNIVHYILAVLLYTTVQFCALVDGPHLLSGRRSLNAPTTADELLETLKLLWMKLVGAALFAWASLEHHRAHVILGNMRKDRTGQKVLHRHHVIPRGGMFEYLAAPHFLFEILIYVAIGIVAWQSWTLWLGPVLFTFVNQALMVNETHLWYLDTFPNYPKHRKRFIPYIF